VVRPPSDDVGSRPLHRLGLLTACSPSSCGAHSSRC
jgi:hypothetical protein